MTEHEEKLLEEGYRRGITQMYVKILREMSDCGINIDKDYLVVERRDVIYLLRMICKDHGDNDWEDNLHMVDIIEKHLEKYLEDKK